MNDDVNNEEKSYKRKDKNNIERGTEVLKINASVLKQTAGYMSKAGDCLEEMAAIYSNPIFFILPDSHLTEKRLKELEDKANAYMYLASSNITTLSKLLNSNEEEGTDDGRNKQ